MVFVPELYTGKTTHSGRKHGIADTILQKCVVSNLVVSSGTPSCRLIPARRRTDPRRVSPRDRRPAVLRTSCRQRRGLGVSFSGVTLNCYWFKALYWSRISGTRAFHVDEEERRRPVKTVAPKARARRDRPTCGKGRCPSLGKPPCAPSSSTSPSTEVAPCLRTPKSVMQKKKKTTTTHAHTQNTTIAHTHTRARAAHKNRRR